MTMRKLIALLLILVLLPALPAQADVLGVKVKEGQTTLDLTGMKKVDSRIETFIEDLKQHPQLTEVNLTHVALSTKNQVKLVQTFPDIHFIWVVELGNAVISSEDTVMDLDTPRGEVKLSQIAQALDALPNIERVIMHKYTPKLSTLDTYLLTPYPDVQFEWTLNWLICDGRRVKLRNDATAFSTGKGRQDPRYTSAQIWERLQYFPDLVAIDVGHNNVSDLSFLTHFPGLRRLICIDSKKPLTDLTPLTELYELEYIELFMQNITDLTPLANHTKLLDLNLATNNITDLSPLYSCTNLQRLWISSNPNLTLEEIEEFQRHVPGCQVVYDIRKGDETGGGWREHPHYDVIKKSFQDNVYYPFHDSIE